MKGILIVDDLEFMRQALREILGSADIPVAGEACNGIEGVDAYLKLLPDVVLMDITMPEMDGLTALKRIRAKDPNARVVMCSALGQESTILKAIRFGARDFIVKPFKPERIISAVGKALNRVQ